MARVGAPPKADWEIIEREYRAGVLSIREIARNHGITDPAIRKVAKAKSWDRNLSAKIDEKVRTELVRDQVRSEAISAAEPDIIQAAAAQVVEVVRGHRRDISRGNSIAKRLMEQLAEAAQGREALQQDIADMTEEDKTAKRYDALMKAVSIPTHAVVVRDLSVAMKNLVALERQAFNIKDESQPDNTGGLAALIASINGTSLPIK